MNLAKMNFQNIIFLLLGVVWVIYNFNKKKKKNEARKAPQARQAQAEPATQQPDSFKSIFQQIMTGEEINPVPAPVESTNISIEDTLQEEDSKLFIQPDKDSVEHKNYHKHKKQETEVLEKITIQKHLDFDIRKAVIYSEILNRPYN